MKGPEYKMSGVLKTCESTFIGSGVPALMRGGGGGGSRDLMVNELEQQL
jgi:hypothetical protein